MKATLKINDKEIEVEITEKELKKLEEKKPRKRWRAEMGGRYWCISTRGVDWSHEDVPDTHQCNEIDNFLYSSGNYFETQEEAEFHKNELIYTQMLKDYIYEHDDVELDWNDEQDRFWLAYNIRYNKIDYCSGYMYKFQGTICASNPQVLKDAVKFIGEENVKKYILKVKE